MYVLVEQRITKKVILSQDNSQDNLIGDLLCPSHCTSRQSRAYDLMSKMDSIWTKVTIHK